MFEVTGRDHAVAPHGGGSFRILLSARPARSLRTRPHCLRGQRRGFLRVEDELAIRPDPSLLKYVPPGDHCSGLSLLVVTWLRASACSQMLGAIWAPESPVPTSPRQKSAATNSDDPWPQRLPAGRHQIRHTMSASWRGQQSKARRSRPPSVNRDVPGRHPGRPGPVSRQDGRGLAAEGTGPPGRRCIVER